MLKSFCRHPSATPHLCDPLCIHAHGARRRWVCLALRKPTILVARPARNLWPLAILAAQSAASVRHVDRLSPGGARMWRESVRPPRCPCSFLCDLLLEISWILASPCSEWFYGFIESTNLVLTGSQSRRAHEAVRGSCTATCSAVTALLAVCASTFKEDLTFASIQLRNHMLELLSAFWSIADRQAGSIDDLLNVRFESLIVAIDCKWSQFCVGLTSRMIAQIERN